MADVLCRFCGGKYHETTEKFTPDTTATGDMFRLKAKYVSWGWDGFPNIPSIYGGDLTCPDCGSPYCSQYFRVKIEGCDEWKPPPYVGPINAEMDRLMAEYDVDAPAEKKAVGPGMAECPYCGYICKASGMHFHLKKHGDING